MSEQEDNEYSSLQTIMFSICNMKLIIMHMSMFM